MPDDDFQARSSEEGRQAQEMAVKVVKASGFTVIDRNLRLKDVGVTVNIVAEDRGGSEWYFDVSGAFTSKRAGLIRTDTMWKTLGRASVLHGKGIQRLLLLTTNLPKPGSVGEKALGASATTFFDALEMLTAAHRKRLEAYAEGRPNQRPLPGLRLASDLYADVTTGLPAPGAAIAVPVDVTGDSVLIRFPQTVVMLPYRLKVFVPSQSKDGNLIPPNERIRVAKRIKTLMSDAAGGCTAQEAMGSWIDPFAGVVDEHVIVVESYASNPYDLALIADIRDLVLHDLDQDTAAMIVDGAMVQFRG